MVASHVAPTGDLACNPGMCPYWEPNQQPPGSQPTLNPLSHASQGGYFLFYCDTQKMENTPWCEGVCMLHVPPSGAGVYV